MFQKVAIWFEFHEELSCYSNYLSLRLFYTPLFEWGTSLFRCGVYSAKEANKNKVFYCQNFRHHSVCNHQASSSFMLIICAGNNAFAMVKNSQEYRQKYWASRSSVRSLTSLTPSLVGQWMIGWLFCLCFFFRFSTIVPLYSLFLGRRYLVWSSWSNTWAGETWCITCSVNDGCPKITRDFTRPRSSSPYIIFTKGASFTGTQLLLAIWVA